MSRCGDQAFTQTGFQNWKKAAEKFKKHEASNCHKESVLKLSTRKAQTVDTILSTQQQRLQATRREGLVQLTTSLMYLLRQGLAIRGHTEVEGNLYQLLKLRSDDSNIVKEWLAEGKYMSHDIINELMEI